MCHSENKYGDKQNKNRWGLQNCEHYLENRYGEKQNKKQWCLQNCDHTWKTDTAINRIKNSGACKTVTTLGKYMR